MNFPNDVPGYTKQNAYRNWGDILRLSDDYDFGWLKGQVRTGVWWEHSSSQRERSDFDATQCFASANCNPWHDNSFADSRLFTGQKTPTSARPRAAASSNISSIPAGISISPLSSWS